MNNLRFILTVPDLGVEAPNRERWPDLLLKLAPLKQSLPVFKKHFAPPGKHQRRALLREGHGPSDEAKAEGGAHRTP